MDYLDDNSGLAGSYAEEIVFPDTEQEAAAFLQESHRKKTPVTISGAGTGVVGGRIPFGGTILSTARLNRVIDINRNSDGSPGGKAAVEPGVSISRLAQEAAKFGLAYLPDPTEKNAFIGGTVATNASGAQGFKYGPTRRYVEGLHIILPSGNVLDIKRGQFIVGDRLSITVSNEEHIECPLPGYRLPAIKNSAGYFISPGTDLLDLFIGQEGTLGFISRIEISLAEAAPESFSGVVFFDHLPQALNFADMLKKRSHLSREQGRGDEIDAACIEYFDEYSLDILRQKYSRIPGGKKAAVYFDQNIPGELSLTLIGRYAEFIEKRGIKTEEVWFAESSHDKELLSAMRYDLPVMVNERVKHNGFSKISTDIATTDEKFPEMFAYYMQKLTEETIPYCIFGHIGENHLHVNLMPEDRNEFIRSKQIYELFITKAVSLKGTIAAEHGIGKLKREYLKAMLGMDSINEMLKIKKAIDPDYILGRGTIFEEGLF